MRETGLYRNEIGFPHGHRFPFLSYYLEAIRTLRGIVLGNQICLDNEACAEQGSSTRKCEKHFLRIIIVMILVWIVTSLQGCRTTGEVTDTKGSSKVEDDVFFKVPAGIEVFRVYVSSDTYVVRQYKYDGLIQRREDKDGDQYIKDMLKPLNKITEEREGLIELQLYPHSGSIAKVRPEKLTFLEELDRVMVDDMQRWVYQFPKKVITPTKFYVRYKIKLQKKVDGQKTLADIEKDYLNENPRFLEYLMYKKKQMELKKKREEQLKSQKPAGN